MKGRRRFLILSVFLVLVGYLFFLFLRTSDDPEFCSSCHFMKPYYDNWLSSTHNQVNCSTCHYGSGFANYFRGKVRLFSEIVRYYLGVYNYEIRSKVDNESCLKCHSEKGYVGKEVKFLDGRISFTHLSHLSEEKIGFKMQCQTCHSELVQGRHEAVSDKICILCHFIGGEVKEAQPVSGCGSCHGPPKDDIMIWGVAFNHSEYIKNKIECTTCHIHVVVGRGDVRLEKCSTCHINVTGMSLSSREMHKIHVSNERINCFKCHDEIKHGKVEIFEVFSPVCQECHGNKHSIQEKIYAGSAGRGIPILPDPMFLSGVSCRGCHEVKLVKTHAETLFELPEFNPISCVNCHGKGYDKLVAQWQKVVKERIEKIEMDVKVAGLLKKTGMIKFNEENVNANLELVKRDGSFGVHNIKYVNILLDEIEKEIKVSRSKPAIELVFKGNSRCLDCHFGIENLNSASGSKKFPHGIHLFKLNCLDCHIGGEPVVNSHGKVLDFVKDCIKCHHRELKAGVECEGCHEKQANFYRGKFLSSEEDFMSQAGISCQDCHSSNGGEPKRPDVSICASCHEQNYVDDFVKKRADLKRVIEKWNSSVMDLIRVLEVGGDKDKVVEFVKLKDEIEKFLSEGSFGAHNLQYIDDLRERIERFMRSLSFVENKKINEKK